MKDAFSARSAYAPEVRFSMENINGRMGAVKHIPGSFEIGVTAHGFSCVLLYGKFGIWKRQHSTSF